MVKIKVTREIYKIAKPKVDAWRQITQHRKLIINGVTLHREALRLIKKSKNYFNYAQLADWSYEAMLAAGLARRNHPAAGRVIPDTLAVENKQLKDDVAKRDSTIIALNKKLENRSNTVRLLLIIVIFLAMACVGSAIFIATKL